MNKVISETHAQLGLAIQQYRQQHHLSMKAFSSLCDVRVAVLKRIEKGEVNFRLTTLIKLLQVMGEALYYTHTKAKEGSSGTLT